jgi:hypothetical protein
MVWYVRVVLFTVGAVFFNFPFILLQHFIQLGRGLLLLFT